MPDPAESGLSAKDAHALLDGIDDAFEQVLHGRFGGGIEVAVLRSADEETSQMLRVPASGMEDRIRILLRSHEALHVPATGRGTVIGNVTLSSPPAKAIDDVSIQTEIFDRRDVNEAADASFFGTGLVFASLPEGSSAPGFCTVRSAESAAMAGRQGARQQRGWLPEQHRHNPSRALGLGSNGHRRSPIAAVALPVSGELLGRLGAVVATVGANNPGLAIGGVTLVVQTGGGAG